jgi:anti-sigma factor RsiW
MSCETYEIQVSAYVDRELSDREAETLFRHLGVCPSCRKVLSDALELRSGLREQEPLLAPEELDENVLRIVRSRRDRQPDRDAVPGSIWKRRLSLRVPVLAVAASVLVFASLVVSFLWLESTQQNGNAKAQTLFLTAVPTVEVQAYSLEPVTTIQ